MWWVDAEETSLLAGKLASLAAVLGLPRTGQVTHDADTALTWLAHSERRLMIFDNATSLADLKRWLLAGAGHVLITSRNPAWGAVGSRLDVDVLPRREAITLLRKRADGLGQQVADELCEELGDLPLALAQAAAFLELTQISPATYLRRLRERREMMLSQGSARSTAGTWRPRCR